MIEQAHGKTTLQPLVCASIDGPLQFPNKFCTTKAKDVGNHEPYWADVTSSSSITKAIDRVLQKYRGDDHE